jgi:ethanolamine ammonia-lyase small subunit
MNELRRFTMARVGLGRAGNSLPTRELLEFQLAHARARDAVHFPFDVSQLCQEIAAPVITLKSAAKDRTEYLRRPDLGRRLEDTTKLEGAFDLVFVIADGLSALAAHRHAIPLLQQVMPRLDPAVWHTAPVVIVEQGRVAVADEIGARLNAKLSVILIGERPGLSAVDSLGVYLTWDPRPGRTDAERNCISNIRPEGLSIGAAAELLLILIGESRMRQLSGVHLNPPPPKPDHKRIARE